MDDPGDLARFFLEVARARAGWSRLISRELATQMTTPVIGEAGPGQSVGLGVFLFDRNGEKLFGHGGADAGFQADAAASLDGGFGVVVMASSENGFKIFDEIERAVFAEYGWPGHEEPAVRVAIDPAPLLGQYAINGWAFAIAQGSARLELRRPYADPIELVPIAPDTVVALEDGMRPRLVDGGRALEVKPPRGGTQTAARLAGGVRLPLLELEAGRFDGAVAAWKERASARIERAGDRRGQRQRPRLRADRPRQARRRDRGPRLVAAVHPDSANAHDSLGEAYATAGDRGARDRRVRGGAHEARRGSGGSHRRGGREFRQRAEEQLAKLRAPRARAEAVSARAPRRRSAVTTWRRAMAGRPRRRRPAIRAAS